MLGALAVLGAGCGGGASGGGKTAASGQPFQIGLTSDFSDTLGYLGLGLRNGAQAYFDSVNRGGGVAGHPIKLNALDDANLTDRGVANMTQLVTQDQVSAVIGFQSSLVCAAALPVATQFRVPLVCATIASNLLKPVQPYAFVATLTTSAEAAPTMAFAKSVVKTPNARVAIISSTSGALMELIAAQTSIAGGMGWKVVDTEILPNNATDPSAAVAKIEASKPDVLIDDEGGDALVIQMMRELTADGQTYPVISYEAIAWTTVSTVNRPNFYYVTIFGYPGATATAPGIKQYLADAKAANLDPVAPNVQRGYFEAMIVTNALRKCGFPCDGQHLQARLQQTDFDSGGMIPGRVQLSATDHAPVHAMTVYQWDSTHTAPQVVVAGLKTGTS